ncbi:hypothetical protein QFC21_003539 [Naganishia friedmannii]|uniref:Uncharacterized protein n=1 Tax=Naganishia friedmannii TaxID=89922 RepID=A0ACC2VNN1_9TREE|nr:hypothetical protein QFC21_003539 [Naganishia friedmannii]
MGSKKRKKIEDRVPRWLLYLLLTLIILPVAGATLCQSTISCEENNSATTSASTATTTSTSSATAHTSEHHADRSVVVDRAGRLLDLVKYRTRKIRRQLTTSPKAWLVAGFALGPVNGFAVDCGLSKFPRDWKPESDPDHVDSIIARERVRHDAVLKAKKQQHEDQRSVNIAQQAQMDECESGRQQAEQTAAEERAERQLIEETLFAEIDKHWAENSRLHHQSDAKGLKDQFRAARVSRKARQNQLDGVSALCLLLLCVLVGHDLLLSAVLWVGRLLLKRTLACLRKIRAGLQRLYLLSLILLYGLTPRDVVMSTAAMWRRLETSPTPTPSPLPTTPRPPGKRFDRASRHSDENDGDEDRVDPPGNAPVMTFDIDRTIRPTTKDHELPDILEEERPTATAAPLVNRYRTWSTDSSSNNSRVYSDHEPVDLSFGSHPPPSIAAVDWTSVSSGSIFDDVGALASNSVSNSSLSTRHSGGFILYSDHSAMELSFGSHPPPSIAAVDWTSVSSGSIFDDVGALALNSVSNSSLSTHDSGGFILYSDHSMMDLSFGSRPPPSIAASGSGFTVFTHDSADDTPVPVENVFANQALELVRSLYPTALVNDTTLRPATDAGTNDEEATPVNNVVLSAVTSNLRAAVNEVQYDPRFPSGLAEPMSPFSARNGGRLASGTNLPRPPGQAQRLTSTLSRGVHLHNGPRRPDPVEQRRRGLDSARQENAAPALAATPTPIRNPRRYHPDGTPKNRRSKRAGLVEQEKRAIRAAREGETHDGGGEGNGRENGDGEAELTMFLAPT